MADRSGSAATYWQVKQELMLSVMLYPDKQVEQLRDRLLKKFAYARDIVEGLIKETDFTNCENRANFRQNMGEFLYQETGIKIPGIGVKDNGQKVVCTIESLKDCLERHKNIGLKWNDAHNRVWHLPFRLIIYLLSREINRLESMEKRDAISSAQHPHPPIANRASFSKAHAPEGPENVIISLPSAKQDDPSSSSSKRENLPLPLVAPEQAIMEKGRAWLRDLHLLLGVGDPVVGQLQQIRQQAEELGKSLARLEQENFNLRGRLTLLAEKEIEVSSRWSHLETLINDNRRLEEELARARQDALGEFFQGMIDRNPAVVEVLLGQDDKPDIKLAGLVEFFRSEGLRPSIPPFRLGERVMLDYKNSEFCPLDFAFSGDQAVEVEIAHQGVAFGSRVLVLPGVRLVKPGGGKQEDPDLCQLKVN